MPARREMIGTSMWKVEYQWEGGARQKQSHVIVQVIIQACIRKVVWILIVVLTFQSRTRTCATVDNALCQVRYDYGHHLA